MIARINDKVKIVSIGDLCEDGSCTLIINRGKIIVNNITEIFNSGRLYMLIVCNFELELTESEADMINKTDAHDSLDDIYPDIYKKNEK